MTPMIPKTERQPVVVSVEQALSMPYATLRFVHLGSRRAMDSSTWPGPRTRSGRGSWPNDEPCLRGNGAESWS